MPDYRFVVNLRSDTFAEPFRESIPTPAYLLAADHATPGMRDLASGVREQGLGLFADARRRCSGQMARQENLANAA